MQTITIKTWLAAFGKNKKLTQKKDWKKKSFLFSFRIRWENEVFLLHALQPMTSSKETRKGQIRQKATA